MARTRAVQTCEACRKAKVRCDRGKPQCSRCSKTSRQCSYLIEEPGLSHGSSSASYTALSDPASPNQGNPWRVDRNSSAASSSASDVSEPLDPTEASNVWICPSPVRLNCSYPLRLYLLTYALGDCGREMSPHATACILSQRPDHGTGYHAGESEIPYLVFAADV